MKLEVSEETRLKNVNKRLIAYLEPKGYILKRPCYVEWAFNIYIEGDKSWILDILGIMSNRFTPICVLYHGVHWEGYGLDSHWLIETHNEYLEEAKRIAKYLEEEFKVDITIRIVSSGVPYISVD